MFYHRKRLQSTSDTAIPIWLRVCMYVCVCISRIFSSSTDFTILVVLYSYDRCPFLCMKRHISVQRVCVVTKEGKYSILLLCRLRWMICCVCVCVQSIGDGAVVGWEGGRISSSQDCCDKNNKKYKMLRQDLMCKTRWLRNNQKWKNRKKNRSDSRFWIIATSFLHIARVRCWKKKKEKEISLHCLSNF